MRILMVGSIHVLHVQRHVNWMLEKGCHILVMSDTTWKPSSCLEYYRIEKLLTFRGAGRIKRGPGKIKFFLPYLWAFQLRNAYRIFKPHIIHAHFTRHHTYACLLAGLKPIVVSVWGGFNQLVDLGGFRENHPFISVNRRILSTADAIIIDSPNMLEPCRKAVNSYQRIALIPFGVDTQIFKPRKPSTRASWRKNLQIPEHSKVLVSPRGWAPYYGQSDILEAFARAYSKFTHQTYLVFCKLPRSHDVQKQIAFIKNRAEQLGIAESIRWLPHLKHDMMPNCYALSDIVINYPTTDSFPSTVLEAAACERHIVSSRLPAYKKTFIEDICTFVEPKNPAALAEAMVVAVNAPEKKLAQKLTWIRQEIIEKYEETIMKERLLGLYRELVSSPT